MVSMPIVLEALESLQVVLDSSIARETLRVTMKPEIDIAPDCFIEEVTRFIG